MSERKFLVAAEATRHVDGGIGPRGTYANNEPYPVEVTVRRVAEKVVFEAKLIAESGYGFIVPGSAEMAATRDKGFRDGQRVRVTIEPSED